jgi:Spy/CpxP family protein refolding chaperone
MKTLGKMLLVAGLLTTAGYGMNAMAEEGCGGPMMMGGKMSHEGMDKMREQHQAKVHDALKLTPAQEPAWQKLVASHKDHPQGLEKLPAPERLEKMIALMQNHLAALKEFYTVLTPEQRKTFDDSMPKPGEFPGMGRPGMPPR